MNLRLVCALAGAAAVSVFACSSSSSPVTADPSGPAGGGSVAADGSVATSDAASGACNAITQHGPSAQIYETSRTPFVATYGTILDGTYLLTGGQRYAMSNTDEIGDIIATLHGTIEITGNVMQTVTTTDTGETRSTLAMSTESNGDLTLTATCQSPGGDAGTIAAMAGTYKYLLNTGEIILELQVSQGVVLTERFTRM